ncbi:MAG: tetratricopeptide repeat protein [Gammaproteobacteria bacterium]|nr:tetratricopeptide repeat protein [Gammaproteobacteria bacterium]
MSFFEELKRRNVIRVGIAYGVAAWFILQLSDVVLENISAPDWVMQTIMLVLVIGLPVVILFAWAFEMTPEGIKKEKDVDRSQSITSVTGRKLDRMIIGILTVTVAYLLIDKLVLQDSPPAPTETVQSAPVETEAPVDTGPSVAVLPFVNMSGDTDNEYFSDGLTETLLHMLAQLPELRVAARTSSFAFKGKDTGIAEISEVLGVAHVLEGSVQKSGNRVRITAQLIRANDGFHVWSQSYDRNLDDIFAIQDEIAKDVAGALDTSLLGGSDKAMHAVNTSNLTAYESYLRGLEQQAIFSYSSLEVAENHFKQALAQDPAFIDARLALVRNYLMKNGTGLLNNDELEELAKPLISQVREQQPDNHLARAFELVIALRKIDSRKSKEDRERETVELRNLLPLIPSETYVRETVAAMLNFFFKQPQQAIEVIQAGLLVDPLEAELHSMLGNIYRDNDQLDQAREALERAQQLAPENPNFYSDLANLERECNDLLAALNWKRRATEVDPQDHELANEIAVDLYALELPEEGDLWFARVKALVPDSPIQLNLEIERAMARKEFDTAIALAEKAIIAQMPDRRNSFANPLFTYASLMLDNGRAREAYDLLVSVRPEITDYSALPTGIEGMMMQMASIRLMTGFESFDTRKEAWLQLTSNLDALGFPWREPKTGIVTDDYLMTGNIPAAVENYLYRLSLPMAGNLQRHKRFDKALYAPVYENPEVAARLAQLDVEFTQLREQVAQMLQQPEWNK